MLLEPFIFLCLTLVRRRTLEEMRGHGRLAAVPRGTESRVFSGVIYSAEPDFPLEARILGIFKSVG